MAPKRKEAPAPAVEAKVKRARPVQKDAKLERQLKEVESALGKAPISPEMRKMIVEALPLSLGQYSDQRHDFQARLVDAISGVLCEAEAALEREVIDARAQHDAAAAEKPTLQGEAKRTEEKLKEQGAEQHASKVALAEAAKSFRAAKKMLEEKETAQRTDASKSKEAARQKDDFATALGHLKVLKTVSPAEGALTKSEVMQTLETYKFEEAMRIALPAALAKAPDARGQFDMMALNQVEMEVGKRLAEQEAILDAAQPDRVRCEAEVQDAQSRLEEARAAQIAAADAYQAAANAQEMASKAAADAQKHAANLEQRLKQLQKDLYNAEAEVEVFQGGPLEVFKTLRDRTTPVVEEPTAIEPSPVVAEVAEPLMVAAC